MNTRTSTLKIALLSILVVCLGLHSRSSDAQESGVPLPFQTDSHVVDPKWSEDSTTFAFTTYNYDSAGVLTWYSYDITTELVTQTDIYPIPVSLANFDFDAVQVANWPGRGRTISISPNGSYLVYLSDVTIDRLHVLGIANIASGEFFITDIPIRGSMKILWSNDESEFLVETGNPSENTIQYFIQNIDSSLNNITSNFLTLSSYVIIYLYDISSDGNSALALVTDGNRPYKLLVWNLQDPSQNTVINDANQVKDARFSVTDSNIILAVNGDRLVGYDITQGPLLIFDKPIDISNIKAAIFSPNQEHLAIVSQADEYSDVVNVLPLNDLLAVQDPSNLTAEALIDKRVKLNWSDNSIDETSFRIERSPNGSSEWIEVGNTPADTMTYEDSGLDASTLYWYRVRALRSGDNQYSEYTQSVSVLTAPADPSQVIATLSAPNQIQISWTDNSTDETNFRIERSTTGTSNWSEIGTATAATYTDLTTSPSTTYYYRVRAYRSSDEQYSEYSTVVNVLTASAAPSNLAGVAVPAGQVNLSWQDNSSDETTFWIERSPNGSTGWAEIGQVDANITAYQDTGLNASTTYYYRVRALRSGDTQYSAYTQPVSVLTSPAGVSQVTATLAAPYQIQVSWTDNSTDETNFRIERSLNGTSGWAEVGSAAANATSYTDSSVNPSTTYYYRVRAYRSDNVFSAYSSVSSGVLTASAAPTGFAGVPLPINKAKLTWTDSSTDETNFRLG